MAKFGGKVGYATGTSNSNGVVTITMTEREYYGDVLREIKQWSSATVINSDLTLNHRISIVADDFAYSNLSTMRYVVWDGVYWSITSVENQRPRLILTLGGVYNGPKAT